MTTHEIADKELQTLAVLDELYQLGILAYENFNDNMADLIQRRINAKKKELIELRKIKLVQEQAHPISCV